MFKPTLFPDIKPQDRPYPFPVNPEHDKPKFTVQEEFIETSRRVNETLDRVLRMEERIRKTLESYTKTITADNVAFKNLMTTTHNQFASEVTNEINSFESDITNAYSTLSTDCKNQIENLVTRYLNEMNAFKEELNNSYGSFREDLNISIDDFKNEINVSFNNYKETTDNKIQENVNEMNDFKAELNETYDNFRDAVESRLEQYNSNYIKSFNDYVTEMNLKLSTMETNFNSDFTAFTNSVNNSIAEFKNQWTKEIDARLDGQDSVINDAVLYMKTNLLSSTSNLIHEMFENGTFANMLENEVVQNLDVRARRDYCTATLYNNNIQDAVTYCKENNKIFYVPYGETLEINETLDLVGVGVGIYGTVRIMFNGIGLIVGGNSYHGTIENIYIRNITHENYDIESDVSVRCVGLTRGNVTIERAYTIQVYADGDNRDMGCVGYSTFNIGTCEKFEIFDKAGTEGKGWINENLFNINRITKELSITGNTFCHDNNVFIKPCLEGAKLRLSNCCRNRFYDVRTEGNFTADFDEKTRYNYISSNFYWQYLINPDKSWLNDRGRNNIIIKNMLEDMEYMPFYIMNAVSFNKDKYTIYEKERDFTIDGDNISPKANYRSLIYKQIIPVENISFIGMESEATNFQLYITPLDAEKNVVFGEPLEYQGGLKQLEDGTYNPGGIYKDAFVEIINKNVKFMEISLSVGIGEIKPFKNVVLFALADKNYRTNLHILSEHLKN